MVRTVVVVAAGVAVLLAGGLLWVVPTASSDREQVAPGDADVVGASQLFDPLSSGLPMTVSWTLGPNTSSRVAVYDCGSDPGCTGQPRSSSLIASASGANGSLSWTASIGAFYAIFPSGLHNGSVTPVNVTVTTKAPLFGGLAGTMLLLAGAAIASLGAAEALWRGRGRPEVAETPPSPSDAAEPAPPEGEGAKTPPT